MNTKSRITLLATASVMALSGGLIAPMAANAKEAGDWLIRGRIISVQPDEKATITPIGGTASIGTEITPELDFTYFFTDNLAAELILATNKHNVSAVGTAIGNIDLGSVWLLPPTLTVQYHFMTDNQVSPYVGAGLNLTLYHSVNSGPVVVDVDYDTSIGFALQAGFDYKINERTYFNIDLKRLWLNTDVTIDAGGLGIVNADVDINPYIIGVGVGFKF